MITLSRNQFINNTCDIQPCMIENASIINHAGSSVEIVIINHHYPHIALYDILSAESCILNNNMHRRRLKTTFSIIRVQCALRIVQRRLGRLKGKSACQITVEYAARRR